ncbi:MAG TPA: VTT domain-containing protein [Phycisphaerales bacterium]|nr:VTT domain-containing protein [Phycisphaerales bacterium]
MTSGSPQPVVPPASTAPSRAVPKWAIHRRLYDWMLTFAHSKYATLALFLFSFTEAIFFPIPPFVLQIPLTLERRSRAWWYAGVTTFASVLGGLVGFWIGGRFHSFATKLFSETALHAIDKYTQDVWLLSAGVIAVHPFKLFTIAAGFVGVPVGSFIIASTIGRSVLFFGIGLLLWLFGPPIRVFIDRYFNLLTILFGVLIIGLVLAAKFL